MANSILKLNVETSEYDAKLKKAAEGIRHLAEVAHKSDGDMTGLEKSALDYIKAVGEMETKSRTAAGQVRELESTFKELTVVYNNLNDVEKADEGGKALAASLERIKQRAQEARAQLDTATQSLNDHGQSGQQSSSILGGLASKFTINIDAIKLFNMGLTAAKAALDVAKDAFFSSESTVDEWGRVVASSQSVYEGFLTAINTGDISGFLDRINDIVSAARKAYDELDKLGTMKTIQAPQISAQQTENERIRNMIMTGAYIAPMDGRRNAVFNGKEMQNGQKLTSGQIRSLEKQLQGGTQRLVNIHSKEVKQTTTAIEAYYNKLAKVNGITLQEYKKGTSTWEEFEKRIRGNEEYRRFEREHTTIDTRTGISHRDKAVNPYEDYRNWNVMRVDKQGNNSFNDLVRLIQQRDSQMAQSYNIQAQVQRTINRVEGTTVRKLLGDAGVSVGTGAGSGASGKTFDTKKIVFTGAPDGVKADPDAYFQSVFAMMDDQSLRKILGVSPQQYDAKQDISKTWHVGQGGSLTQNPEDKYKEKEKSEKTLAENMSTLTSGVQTLFSGIEQVGIEIPGGLKDVMDVMQGLCSIIQGVQTIISVFSTGAMTANTAAIIANTAALTTNSIMQIFPFSTGGIVHAANGWVGGNSMSGDRVPAMLNSGELVLNRAQQGVLANALGDSGAGNMQLSAVITGEQIRLVLNNNGRRTGRGEYVTTKFR